MDAKPSEDRTEDVSDPTTMGAPEGSDRDQKRDSEPALTGELVSAGSQQLHRKLGGKEIQLFAVGGAIGTCTESALQCLP